MTKGDELKDRLHYFESLDISCTRQQFEEKRRVATNLLRWLFGAAALWIFGIVYYVCGSR